MTVLLKKDEKIRSVIASLPEGYSENDFVTKFIALYPSDWKKIERTYRDHKEKTKPGKIQPMPKPEQYVINALKVCLKAHT